MAKVTMAAPQIKTCARLRGWCVDAGECEEVVIA
jgi:hypothetical protein